MKRLLLPLTIGIAACGGPAPTMPNEIDVRVTQPAPEPNTLLFAGGESVIAPGEDKMICTHLRYDGDDIAFDNVESLQGKYGHHAILLGAKKPLPPGTIEDCSRPEDMAKYDGYTIPEQLPDGLGILLPKGKAMVFQTHYLNAGLVPLRVRDFVRFHTLPVANVKTWAAMMATNSVLMKIQPGMNQTYSFDCTMSQDANLILFGGHMHGWGSKFQFQVGADVNSLKSIYEVDPWKGEFRDTPPITFAFNKPIQIAKGSVLRTTCTWNNDTGKMIEFPGEMCSTFAYISGTKQAEICNIGAN